MLTLLNLTRDGTKAQISPFKAGVCKRLPCEYVNTGVKRGGGAGVHICLCCCVLVNGCATVCTFYMHTTYRRNDCRIKWLVIKATKPVNYSVITFNLPFITMSVLEVKRLFLMFRSKRDTLCASLLPSVLGFMILRIKELKALTPGTPPIQTLVLREEIIRLRYQSLLTAPPGSAGPRGRRDAPGQNSRGVERFFF